MNSKVYSLVTTILVLVASVLWLRKSIVTLPQALETTYFYVIAVFASIAIIFFLESRKAGRGGWGSGLIAGFLSASLATYLLLVGLGSSFDLQTTIASIILWILAYTLISGGALYAKSLALPLALLALAIPLPNSFITTLSIKLASASARVASFLAGAKLVSTSYGLALLAQTPSGSKALLYVSRACSGIYGLTAVLSVAPLVVYIVSRSSAGIARRVFSAVASLAASALIVLLFSTARIALAVKAVEENGLNYSFKILHYTPPILYVAFAGITCIVMALKLTGKPEIKRISNNSSKPELKHLIAAIAILSVIIASGLYVSIQTQTQTESVKAPSVTYLLSSESPLLNLSFNGASSFGLKEDLALEQAIRIPKVYTMYVRVGEDLFKCYIELSSQKTLFHAWPVCLYYQRAEITWSYAEQLNISSTPININYLVVKQMGGYRLLAYTIIPLKADYGGVTAPLYEKITLLGGWGSSAESVVKEYSFKAKLLLKNYLNRISSLSYMNPLVKKHLEYTITSFILAASVMSAAFYVAYSRLLYTRIK